MASLATLSGCLGTIREPPRRPTRRGIRPHGVVLHHSCGRTTATVAELRAEHEHQRGWCDIGYHWVVREYEPGKWRAEPGRPEEYVGAHAPGRNDWLGVCVLGDYEANECPAAALEALVGCLSDLCDRYEINPEKLRPHKETGCQRPDGTRGETKCPGEHLIAALPRLREQVSALLSSA